MSLKIRKNRLQNNKKIIHSNELAVRNQTVPLENVLPRLIWEDGDYTRGTRSSGSGFWILVCLKAIIILQWHCFDFSGFPQYGSTHGYAGPHGNMINGFVPFSLTHIPWEPNEYQKEAMEEFLVTRASKKNNWKDCYKAFSHAPPF